MTFFYTHLVDIESVIANLDELDLKPEQKIHLTALIDSAFHSTILDLVLSQLQEEDKKAFVGHLTRNEHENIWKLLNDRIDNIEEKIKKVAEDLKKELHQDLDHAKKVKLKDKI